MVQTNSIKPLIICGPTCSGKSDVANTIAPIINGEIISADSMQIYKEFNIGTAKITESEMSVKHYMIDIADANAEFSVAEYANIAKNVIADIKRRKKVPIIAGGTGLYINSIIFDYDFNQCNKNDEIRRKYQKFSDENGKDALYALLKEKNPNAYEKLHMNDTKRIIRALEIAELGGISIPSKQLNDDYVIIGIDVDRKTLYDKINKRVEHMFTSGLELEVKNIANKYGFEIQAMQAIGYKEFKGYFNGEYDRRTLMELIKRHTRNYAKRQITWLKQIPNIVWLKKENITDNILKLYD